LQALLIVDFQVGLFQLARDWDGTLFKQNIKAHATIGKLFDLPVVITSSAETGPNGPVLKEFVDLFPNAPYIKRGGEVECVSFFSESFQKDANMCTQCMGQCRVPSRSPGYGQEAVHNRWHCNRRVHCFPRTIATV
jgi:nicotinamidase-related amidase